jgi:hypothetical protein
MDKLRDIYFNPGNPGSFGGTERLLQASGHATRKAVKEFLHSEEAYARHKQYFSKFRRRKVMVPHSNYLWQADLVFMRKYKRFNKSFQYILTVIDCFSRYAFAVPIRSKHSDEIIRAFSLIFKSYSHKPKYLECDRGLEFYNSKFQKFLREHSITLYSNHSDLKACIVERWNRTLLTRISKYFTATGQFDYISVLDAIVRSYNRSFHRSIGTEPINVNRNNESDVWLHLYKDLFTRPCKKPKLKLYDQVRLCKRKQLFQKGYSTTYTNEVFQISEVLDTIPITFKVKDKNGETLGGIFYEQELIKI